MITVRIPTVSPRAITSYSRVTDPDGGSDVIKKKRQAAKGKHEQNNNVKKVEVGLKNQRLTRTKFFSQMENDKVMAPIRAEKKKRKLNSEKKTRIEKLKL